MSNFALDHYLDIAQCSRFAIQDDHSKNLRGKIPTKGRGYRELCRARVWQSAMVTMVG